MGSQLQCLGYIGAMILRQFPVKFAALLFSVTLSAAPLTGQRVPVGDPLEDYIRLLQVAGRADLAPLSIRPLSRDRVLRSIDAEQTHPWQNRYSTARDEPQGVWYRFPDPKARAYWNSDHPVMRADGAVWQGKGGTLQLAAGATLGYGPVTASFYPSFIVTQNREFEIVDVPSGFNISPFGDPWYGGAIDRPQRFGADGYSTFDLGQSSVRLDYGVLALGGGTENLWWGPAVRNGIVMSNSAPGFPHAFLGTSGPANIAIGKVQAQWIWGRLAESDYFDDDPDNDGRYVTGLVFDFEPAPIPGLYLGGSRLFYQLLPPGGLDFSDLFLVFQGVTKDSQSTPQNPTGNDERDQLISLFGRWVFPESGFEAYVEWARNDHARDLRDFVLQPAHSQAYTVGFQKVFELASPKLLRVHGEATHLELSKTLLDRPNPTYYVHGIVRQGYTHRGQVVGASIGPGGNSQYLGIDLFANWGKVGGFFLREDHDLDAYYRLRQQGALGVRQNDVEMTLGVTARVFFPAVDLSGTLAWGRELNRYFVSRNDVTNLHLDVGLRWRWGQ